MLVEAGASGEYELVSEGVLTGSGADKTFDRVLGKLLVSGPEAARLRVDERSPAYVDLRGHQMDALRTITFTQLNDDEHFFINGQIYNVDRTDTRVPLGNYEEWTIRNDTSDMHVFHIHQLSFQITEINGVAQSFTGYVDDVRVPEKGQVKIRMAFTIRSSSENSFITATC